MSPNLNHLLTKILLKPSIIKHHPLKELNLFLRLTHPLIKSFNLHLKGLSLLINLSINILVLNKIMIKNSII